MVKASQMNCILKGQKAINKAFERAVSPSVPMAFIFLSSLFLATSVDRKL
jgi:hypothetical protein